MVGKQSGQMGFGDLEATARVPEGHFLKKIDNQIDAGENPAPTPTRIGLAEAKTGTLVTRSTSPWIKAAA